MSTTRIPGRQAKRPSRSAWLAALFVCAAGALAWFGTSGPGTGARDRRPTTTIPVTTQAPAPEQQARRISRGNLPTRVVISRAGIDTPIAEVGVIDDGGRPVWETAWRAAGHHLDSALPGQPGNMVLTGHVSVADSANVAVFRTLDSVVQGDVIEVYSGDAVFKYKVSRISIVQPSAVTLLRSDQDSLVTLITCTRDLKNRLVVVGKLV